MAQRHIHYEAAFEDYMRSRGWPYLPVQEHRKALFAGGRVKLFDFLLYRPDGVAWLVDVKGRKFPYEINGTKRYWENWVTREDLEGLDRWDQVFGPGYQPVLVFVYWLVGVAGREPTRDLHLFRNKYYSFLWIPAAQYAAHARTRSPSWGTVSMPNARFRELVKPLSEA